MKMISKEKDYRILIKLYGTMGLQFMKIWLCAWYGGNLVTFYLKKFHRILELTWNLTIQEFYQWCSLCQSQKPEGYQK